MKEAFISGFIKASAESGLSNEEILSLWKTASEVNDIKEAYNNLSDDTLKQLKMSSEDLHIVYELRNDILEEQKINKK